MAIGEEGARAPDRSLPPETRNRLAGLLLLAAGGILLIVSVFLNWFEPGLSAWTVFEVWDIVLAACGLAAILAAAGAMGMFRALPERWVLAAAALAPIVVFVSLVNHPPAAQGTGQDPMVGIWLALAGSLLMLLGAAVAMARISLAVNLSDAAPAATPASGRAGRFARGQREPADPAAAPSPEAPVGGGDGRTSPTRRVIP